MKKFIVSAVCAIVVLCSIPFAACSSESSGLINLADCEIGYELPVYPDCEFDYKVDDDCVVHISEIKAVLTAKNEINEGDLVEEEFARYQITITATGYANTTADKTEYSLYLNYGFLGYSTVFILTTTIQDNNNLDWEENININSYSSTLIFRSIV